MSKGLGDQSPHGGWKEPGQKDSIWNGLRQAVGSILSRDKGGQKLSGSNWPRTQGQGCSSCGLNGEDLRPQAAHHNSTQADRTSWSLDF